jgi:hypothetical protein
MHISFLRVLTCIKSSAYRILRRSMRDSAVESVKNSDKKIMAVSGRSRSARAAPSLNQDRLTPSRAGHGCLGAAPCGGAAAPLPLARLRRS